MNSFRKHLFIDYQQLKSLAWELTIIRRRRLRKKISWNATFNREQRLKENRVSNKQIKIKDYENYKFIQGSRIRSNDYRKRYEYRSESSGKTTSSPMKK